MIGSVTLLAGASTCARAGVLFMLFVLGACATKKGTSVEGSLTKVEIETEIRAELSQVKKCFETFLVEPEVTSHPARLLSIRIVTIFLITAQGEVEKSKSSADFTPNPANPLLSLPAGTRFLACVTNVTNTYVFQKPRGGGTVQVKYPFVFHHAQ